MNRPLFLSLLLCLCIPITPGQAPEESGGLTSDDERLKVLKQLGLPAEGADAPPLPGATETAFNPGPSTFLQPSPVPLEISSAALNENHSGRQLVGRVLRPLGTQPLAAVLLVPELWGVNEGLLDLAAELARKGFVVLALDIYEGQTPQNRPEALRLMFLSRERDMAAYLGAAFDWLAENAAPQPLKVGVAGWGIGGSYALQAAAAGLQPDALAVFYADPPRDVAGLAKLTSPILGIYATEDGWITQSKLDHWTQAMKDGGNLPQIVTFSTRPGFALRPEDRMETAWAHTARDKLVDFLTRTLSN